MAKKIYAAKARIVKGARWYIDYTTIDVETQQETRHRRDFDLNDIADLTIREAVARRIADNLQLFIRQESKPAPVEDAGMGMADAVRFAVKIKTAKADTGTNKQYFAVERLLLKWLEARAYMRMPASQFTRKYARAFFDWYITNGTYRGKTVNGRIAHLRALWNVLIDREICQANPWKSIKPVALEPKLRKTFSPEERAAIAREAEATDYWIFRGILLQFFCYIRPIELSRLRFKHFDFSTGTVQIEVRKGKRPRARFATIPRAILPYFLDGRFEKYPGNYYVFGAESTEHKEQRLGASAAPAHPDWQYRRHRKILEALKERGELGNIENLTWYSWKDTGISLHAHKTTPLATKDQAGHTDFDVTLIYYHAAMVNSEYAALPNDLF